MCGDCGGCGVYLKSPHFVVIWQGILCISNYTRLGEQGTWTPSQNTLILLNKNLKIYESVVDKEVNIGQKAYDFPMVSQAAFEN